MRAKQNTPKYGLLYQASLVGGVANQLKGKVCRTLAAKCALCVRCDALSTYTPPSPVIYFLEEDEGTLSIGLEAKLYVEKRIKFLESNAGKAYGSGKGGRGRQDYQKQGGYQARGGYNKESDFTVGQSVPPLADNFVKKQLKTE